MRLTSKLGVSISLALFFIINYIPTTFGIIFDVYLTAIILDARALYPDSSLADLYDELTMPPELRKAHQENDRAVMQAYGFGKKMTESECVVELMKMYSKLTENE